MFLPLSTYVVQKITKETMKSLSYLNVNEESLERPVGIVHCEVKVELLHEEQLVVEDDVGGALLVALDVQQELVHRDVELLNLARQERARHASGSKV